jgi:hypothetical protein
MKRSFLAVVLLSILFLIILFLIFPKRPTLDLEQFAYKDVKKQLRDKFLVFQECKNLGITFNGKEYNATFSCRDFDMYRIYSPTFARSIYLYKRPVSINDSASLFLNFYAGYTYKTLFGCHILGRTINNTNEIFYFAYNCSYGLYRYVQFDMKNNIITEKDRGLVINLTKTSTQELIQITKKLYNHTLNNYVNVTVPQSLNPDSCSAVIKEDTNFIHVSLCNDTYILSVNKTVNRASIIDNTMERLEI